MHSLHSARSNLALWLRGWVCKAVRLRILALDGNTDILTWKESIYRCSED